MSRAQRMQEKVRGFNEESVRIKALRDLRRLQKIMAEAEDVATAVIFPESLESNVDFKKVSKNIDFVITATDNLIDYMAS